MRVPRVGPDPLAINVQERRSRTSHDGGDQRQDRTAPAVANRVVHCPRKRHTLCQKVRQFAHTEKSRGAEAKSTAQTHCRAQTIETEEGEEARKRQRRFGDRSDRRDRSPKGTQSRKWIGDKSSRPTPTRHEA